MYNFIFVHLYNITRLFYFILPYFTDIFLQKRILQNIIIIILIMKDKLLYICRVI